MKVCLINPTTFGMYPGSPPISLAIIASYLRKFNHEIKIVDLAAGENFVTALEEFKPDVVGVTATTPVIMEAYFIADECKKRGFKVIMGGPHASVSPDEAKLHADFIVIGEGEIVFKKILDLLEKGCILPGTEIWRGEPIMNLDEIPMPAYDLLNMEFYLTLSGNKLLSFIEDNNRMACILTSRGCPYNCTFCHNSFKSLKYRYNSPERVVDEIEYLIDKYAIESVFFIEDNFFVDNERVKAISRLLLKRNVYIEWGANARVDNLDEETLRIAKHAGCRQVTFGWESGSQRMLDVYNKRTTVKQNEDSIKLCNKLGLWAHGTIMIGGPGEDMEDLRLSCEFMKNNEFQSCGVCITTPFPGTQLFEWAKKEKLMNGQFDPRRFNFSNIPVKLFDKNISEEDMMRILQTLRYIGGLRTRIAKDKKTIEFIEI